METIQLTFEPTLVGLAGNPFGRRIFKEQIKDKGYNASDYTIVFPDKIKRIASSFVQGFFSEWLSIKGYNWINEHVSVKTSSDELTQFISKNLV